MFFEVFLTFVWYSLDLEFCKLFLDEILRISLLGEVFYYFFINEFKFAVDSLIISFLEILSFWVIFLLLDNLSIDFCNLSLDILLEDLFIFLFKLFSLSSQKFFFFTLFLGVNKLEFDWLILFYDFSSLLISFFLWSWFFFCNL